jgi:hypothetical protein
MFTLAVGWDEEENRLEPAGFPGGCWPRVIFELPHAPLEPLPSTRQASVRRWRRLGECTERRLAADAGSLQHQRTEASGQRTYIDASESAAI